MPELECLSSTILHRAGVLSPKPFPVKSRTYKNATRLCLGGVADQGTAMVRYVRGGIHHGWPRKKKVIERRTAAKDGDAVKKTSTKKQHRHREHA